MDLEIVNYSEFHIHALLKDTNNHAKCLVSGFYGRLEITERHLSWELLNHVNMNIDIHWC